MERERLMMNAAFHHQIESSATVEMMKSIKTEFKQEFKQEIEEILSSEEEKMEIESISSTTTEKRPKLPFSIDALVSDSTRRKHTDEDSDCCMVRDDEMSQEAPVKRRKLLTDTVPVQPKKSPPNSYKSLIKQANFKSYLSETIKTEQVDEEEPTPIPVAPKKDPVVRRRRRKGFKSKKAVLKIKKRKIAIPKNLRKKRKIRKAKRLVKQEIEIVDMTEDDKIEIKTEVVEEPIVEEEKQEPDIKIEEPQDDETCSTILPETGTSTPTSQMTNIDVTIDMVAKGYFSEPDILSSISKKRLKRLKHESRSKSEQSREKQDKLTKLLKEKARAIKERKKAERAKKQIEEVQVTEPEVIEIVSSPQSPAKKPPKASKKVKTSSKRPKKKAQLVKPEAPPPPPPPPLPTSTDKTEEDNNNVVKIDDDVPLQEILKIAKKSKKKLLLVDPLQLDAPSVEPGPEPIIIATPEESPPPINDPDTVNNNNDKEFQPPLSPPPQTTKCGGGTGQKRTKSRFKFGTRKRHRVYHTKEEEIIIPRRVNSIPKWCNGWSWQGRPFQAKVFLNVSGSIDLIGSV